MGRKRRQFRSQFKFTVALEAVKGNRQQLGRAFVEARGDDGCRGDRAHQGVAALGNLVGGDRQQRDGAESE